MIKESIMFYAKFLRKRIFPLVFLAVQCACFTEAWSAEEEKEAVAASGGSSVAVTPWDCYKFLGVWERREPGGESYWMALQLACCIKETPDVEDFVRLASLLPTPKDVGDLFDFFKRVLTRKGHGHSLFASDYWTLLTSQNYSLFTPAMYPSAVFCQWAGEKVFRKVFDLIKLPDLGRPFSDPFPNEECREMLEFLSRKETSFVINFLSVFNDPMAVDCLLNSSFKASRLLPCLEGCKGEKSLEEMLEILKTKLFKRDCVDILLRMTGVERKVYVEEVVESFHAAKGQVGTNILSRWILSICNRVPKDFRVERFKAFFNAQNENQESAFLQRVTRIWWEENHRMAKTWRGRGLATWIMVEVGAKENAGS